ncbi:transcriptional regulator, LacI family [Paenibacillus sp. UNCCL117]|uniref:LacI family DNA-binding transcriptional regulator n=1 Tax=unclassified Paenibacillus TaxID=185978 RepID=UPI0008863FEB|nr:MULTISPECIES: LacI family DNA-binding transcriptional regulator [unclassified Paenibacillus]SDE22186.1 DNA-binding transcriptional regulator, LacI/PurR family [Paenibacillus sp. cl123]SFW43048.1 transcriptional regulator, LacI family [Paenibacillus sp. UNCCL117]
MKITIQDIAHAAQVAKSTVSKVINDSPRISEETKQRVRAIMKEMNYTPSSLATTLAKQSSFNIGLLIDMSKENEYMNPFFYNIMVGIKSVTGPLKYELTLSSIHDGGPESHFLKRLVLSRRIDGLIANNAIMTDDIAHKLNELRFPFVVMGEYPSAPSTWVDYDNMEGGCLLTKHLLTQGYRKIAFIGGERGERLFEKRFQGYANTLRQAGLQPNEAYTLNGPSDETHGCRAVSALLPLDCASRPDALLCMNNYVAFGALKTAREAGIPVPVQLGIATFDDYPFSPHTSPPLTSLHIDTLQLGVTAGKMLMERIRTPDSSQRSLLLSPELIVRESTNRSGSPGGMG